MNETKIDQLSALYQEFVTFIKRVPLITLFRISNGYEADSETNPNNLVHQLKTQGRDKETIFSLYRMVFTDDCLTIDIDTECGMEMKLTINIEKLNLIYE